MSECGFYHPGRGYWQAIGEVPEDIRESYPEGTIEVPLRPSPNHEWKGGEWVEMPAPPLAREDLLDYLAERRWRAEIGGCDWNGWHLRTDEASQGKYLAELEAISLGVRQDGELWKFPHGFEPVTNAQMREMAIAARQHITGCFALEAHLAADIQAGRITTLAEIDAAFASFPAS
ncbi:DUF4376 domain-containing protein [Telmatospirillum sp. J64-1]|uniref:DUF4376 domain-containing protein n=1 Tax=Telmatospirillum sp. J64-1 TaxID=2502183 RepID=UPI00115D2684|nr:DUF4376 domain-containing protein [Telmatospirillum sp. J64-1]